MHQNPDNCSYFEAITFSTELFYFICPHLEHVILLSFNRSLTPGHCGWEEMGGERNLNSLVNPINAQFLSLSPLINSTRVSFSFSSHHLKLAAKPDRLSAHSGIPSLFLGSEMRMLRSPFPRFPRVISLATPNSIFTRVRFPSVARARPDLLLRPGARAIYWSRTCISIFKYSFLLHCGRKLQSGWLVVPLIRCLFIASYNDAAWI